jgi:hypothetical protein
LFKHDRKIVITLLVQKNSISQKKVTITNDKSKTELSKIKITVYLCRGLILTQMKPNTQQLNDLTIQVRRDILQMVHAVNSGHPGGSLGCRISCRIISKYNGPQEGFEMDGGEKTFSSFQTGIFLLLQR